MQQHELQLGSSAQPQPLTPNNKSIGREIEEQRALATGSNTSMAPPKSLALAALLLAVAAAGQVPLCAGLGTSPNSSVLVSGVVPCAAGSSINIATVPVFPNAAMQFVCGSKVVSSTTADANGAFLFSLPGVSNKQLLNDMLVSNQCKVVVVTPLAACDKSLAAATGTLTAPVKLLGIDTGSGSGSGLGGLIGLIVGIVSGLIGGIINLTTDSFSLI